jgi:hypothetical protein
LQAAWLEERADCHAHDAHLQNATQRMSACMPSVMLSVALQEVRMGRLVRMASRRAAGAPAQAAAQQPPQALPLSPHLSGAPLPAADHGTSAAAAPPSGGDHTAAIAAGVSVAVVLALLAALAAALLLRRRAKRTTQPASLPRDNDEPQRRAVATPAHEEVLQTSSAAARTATGPKDPPLPAPPLMEQPPPPVTQRRVGPPDHTGLTSDTVSTAWSYERRRDTLEDTDAKRRLITALDNMAAAQPPQLFAGLYALLRERAEGGQAVVNLARDATGLRQYAIKFFHSREEFEEEAALYRDPVVAQALPALLHAADNASGATRTASGYAFPPHLVIERGMDLAEWRRRPRSYAEVLGVVDSVAQLLATLHASGRVHRDLKYDYLSCMCHRTLAPRSSHWRQQCAGAQRVQVDCKPRFWLVYQHGSSIDPTSHLENLHSTETTNFARVGRATCSICCTPRSGGCSTWASSPTQVRRRTRVAGAPALCNSRRLSCSCNCGFAASADDSAGLAHNMCARIVVAYCTRFKPACRRCQVAAMHARVCAARGCARRRRVPSRGHRAGARRVGARRAHVRGGRAGAQTAVICCDLSPASFHLVCW